MTTRPWWVQLSTLAPQYNPRLEPNAEPTM